MPTTLELPIPPSVNALWRNGKGRTFRSRRYIDWLRTAGWELKAQRPKRYAGAVAVTVAAGRPDKRKRDLDNIAGKAVLDLLVAHQVIHDDRNVTALSARWCDTVAPGRIAIFIKELAP